MKLAAVLLLIGCSAPLSVASAPAIHRLAVPQTQVGQTPAPQAIASHTSPSGRALPDRLSDADFWALETSISEPGGYFQIEDNFTSNEIEVGELYTALQATHVHGGVYMGVGPEQNFTYISAIHPAMAFIVDIRRQAVMQHLMFKAIFELAADRGDFISILFSKPRPAGIDSTTPIQKIWTTFSTVLTDTALATRNYNRIVERLTKTQGFVFTADESAKLAAVFNAFTYYGPSISTRGGGQGGRGNTSDFADLTGYAMDASGKPQSFLSSEDNYRVVKSLQDRNLIVPVSGDFGGPKAIRAIGAYLADHKATLSAFYLSNVEQYLFMDGKQAAFYANVSNLPTDSTSVFIRPYSMRRGYGGGGTTKSLCPIGAFLGAVMAGHVTSNNDALACPQ